MTDAYRFDRFVLDPEDRRLRREGRVVELNARYFDALHLLVREEGRLVTKDRFLDEVWRGVPVTEEALTQCIRTLRRQLGDEAARPRFIETAPKHGYRFIAPVERVEPAATEARPSRFAPPLALRPAWASALGGGAAGALGGLAYGLAAVSPGMGAASAALVLILLTMLVGMLGGGGVGLGLVLTARAPGPRWRWSLIGGALGGLVVGGLVELLGLDAFNLLLGQAPADVTGAGEGALLGAAVGFGAWLGLRLAGPRSRLRATAPAAALGALAGAAIPLMNGRLMGGSLSALQAVFPNSRLSLGGLGSALGDDGFGRMAQALTGAAEGALFAAAVAAAMILARPRD